MLYYANVSSNLVNSFIHSKFHPKFQNPFLEKTHFSISNLHLSLFPQHQRCYKKKTVRYFFYLKNSIFVPFLNYPLSFLIVLFLFCLIIAKGYFSICFFFINFCFFLSILIFLFCVC